MYFYGYFSILNNQIFMQIDFFFWLFSQKRWALLDVFFRDLISSSRSAEAGPDLGSLRANGASVLTNGPFSGFRIDLLVCLMLKVKKNLIKHKLNFFS